MSEARIEKTKADVRESIEKRKALVESRYEEAMENARYICFEANRRDDPYAFEKAIESLPIEVLIELIHRKTSRIMADDNWAPSRPGPWDHLLEKKGEADE